MGLDAEYLHAAMDEFIEDQKKDAVKEFHEAAEDAQLNQKFCARIEKERAAEEEQTMESILNKVPYLKRKPKAKWDAATIISTYSNTDNHPSEVAFPTGGKGKKNKKRGELDEPVGASGASDAASLSVDLAHVTLSGKTGMPMFEKWQKGTLGGIGEEGEAGSVCDEGDYSDNETCTTSGRENLGAKRGKETPEERKARKAAVKEQRAQRRMEKKATTDVFKEESVGIKKIGKQSSLSTYKY